MKKKTIFQVAIALTSFFAIAISILVGNGNLSRLIKKADADQQTYTITLNSLAFSSSELTTTYQQNVIQNFGNDKPVINYFLAKKNSSNNLVLAPSGKIFNYSSNETYKGRITNIVSLTVNYSGGTLFVQEGLGGDALNYGEKSQISSGVEKSLTQKPNYLMISNSSSETTITSVSIKYTCSDPGFAVERLGTTYNGMGADQNVYTLTRNGSSVSLAGQSGTISLTNSGNFTISLASGTIVFQIIRHCVS